MTWRLVHIDLDLFVNVDNIAIPDLLGGARTSIPFAAEDRELRIVRSQPLIATGMIGVMVGCQRCPTDRRSTNGDD
jgi:hypothetical protein